jgi:putative ABC transport system substrate-binding protein
MRRREFIAGLGSVAALPALVKAQQPSRMPRIGVLMQNVATEPLMQWYAAAFTQGMRELGWINGQNIHIAFRSSGNDLSLARIYAAQLIGLMPDVILSAATYNLAALREATSTVPVVFVDVSDPVAQGFVASMSRPGGNITGFSLYEFSIGGKLLGLLKAAAPRLLASG